MQNTKLMCLHIYLYMTYDVRACNGCFIFSYKVCVVEDYYFPLCSMHS